MVAITKASHLICSTGKRLSSARCLAGNGQQLAFAGSANAAPEEINGVKLIARVLDGVDGKGLRGVAEDFRKQVGSGVVALIGVTDGKAAITVAATSDVTDRVNAADLARAAARPRRGELRPQQCVGAHAVALARRIAALGAGATPVAVAERERTPLPKSGIMATTSATPRHRSFVMPTIESIAALDAPHAPGEPVSASPDEPEPDSPSP